MPDSEPHVVIILEGATAYDSINAWNREVERIVLKTGLHVRRISIDDGDAFIGGLKKVMEDYPQRIATALCFSGFAVEIGDKSPRGNIWKHLGIPIVTWLLDHPCYFLARHYSQAAAVMRVYPNNDFLHFHRDYVKAPYRTAFCGFGAMDFGRTPQPRAIKPGETPLIIFPKSGSNPKTIEETWKLLPRVMQRIIRDSIDHYWGQTPRSGPVSNSVLAAADAAGLELRNDLSLFAFFIAQIDDYVRKSKVDILIRQMLPYPVKIYGNGIDYIDTSKARAQILAPVPYEQMIDLSFEAHAIISMNQNIDHECHDRPYIAMGAGALPISDINPWWQAHHPALMPYSYNFRDGVAGAIEKVLANPQMAAEVGWKESQRQRAARTFETMVLETLELAVMHRYYTFNFQPPQPYFAKWGD